MKFEKTLDCSGKRIPDQLRVPLGRETKRRMITGLVITAALFCSAQDNQQLSQNKIPILPINSRIPDANDQAKMNEQANKEKNFEATNIERKKQIADDSAMLLKLATDLKTEVDKTNKDTLSLAVIRKADAIERLAHNVKEKMKLSVGAN